ncbi:hypothetical protein [Sediminitomix flava]|uniref:DUF4468 domain-containing protein n=1 Tax=Sediminitomix flava TaxID=379075 RepID=A0A315YX87_SEDFL|nr:hypothetical protein [Sediminitomix flava]PWJ33670.1 hypothetical protein BC781_11217 [Sediminitomix flava]
MKKLIITSSILLLTTFHIFAQRFESSHSFHQFLMKEAQTVVMKELMKENSDQILKFSSKNILQTTNINFTDTSAHTHGNGISVDVFSTNTRGTFTVISFYHSFYPDEIKYIHLNADEFDRLSQIMVKLSRVPMGKGEHLVKRFNDSLSISVSQREFDKVYELWFEGNIPSSTFSERKWNTAMKRQRSFVN